MRTRPLLLAVLAATTALVTPAHAAGWQEEVVDRLPGAAFSTVADLDGDRRPEILATSFGVVAGFGPTSGGTVAAYRRTAHGWLRQDLIRPS